MCHESSKKIVDELGTDVFNVKRERLFKCITFQDILHLCLSNSAIAISNHLDSPSVTAKFITVCMVMSILN